MEVDPIQSSVTTEYDGTLYYFCSEGCKHQFEQDPERFVDGTSPTLATQDGVTTPRLTSESSGGTFELHTQQEDELGVGDTVTLRKTITDDDVHQFAIATSDTNALHLNEQFARRTRFEGRIVHGTLVAGLISAALASFPGITIYLSQSLEFHGPVSIGETATAHCRIDDRIESNRYRLTTTVETEAGKTVIDGTATVLIDELPLT
jgi:acyl dehydratase/YHS domain-containing protein